MKSIFTPLFLSCAMLFSCAALAQNNCQSAANRCTAIETVAALTIDNPYEANTTTTYFSSTEIPGTPFPLAADFVFNFVGANPAATVMIIDVTNGTSILLDTDGETFSIPENSDFNFTVNALEAGEVTVTITATNGGTPVIATPATIVVNPPLPVTWARPLTGRTQKESLDLTWSVTDQVAVDRYVVEASVGEAFTAIQDVTYQPAEGEVVYETTVPAPTGTTYYRIRQYDLDGASSLSNTIQVVGTEAPAALRLFPNPATDVLNLRSEEPVRQLIFFSADGRRVMDLAGPGQRVSLAALPAGLYTVAAEFTDGSATRERLVVR